MTLIHETAVLDPVEFIPERQELGLDDLGINVVSVDWGDAEMEKFYIKQKAGEIPAGQRPPNRKVVFKLQAQKDFNKSTLAEALYRLQQKVGTMSEKGGWVRRDMNPESGFALSVGAIVYNAVLGGVQGWMLAHREIANEITLTLTIGPYFYGTQEVEAVMAIQAGGTDLEYEIENIKGTAPGLIRTKIENQGLAPWRLLLNSAMMDDHPQDATVATTARFGYLSTGFELGPEAEVSPFAREFSENPGKNPVEMICTTVYKTLLRINNLTHTGSRRVWVRVWARSNDTIYYKLKWKTAGASSWQVNKAAVITATNEGWYYLDLGEIPLDNPVLGGAGWEAILQAKSSTIAGAPRAIADKIYVFDNEFFDLVSTPDVIVEPDGIAETAAAATITAAGWTNPNNAKTKNGTYAQILIEATKLEEISAVAPLQGTGYGFAIPETATIIGVEVILYGLTENVVAGSTETGMFTKLIIGGVEKGSPESEELPRLGPVYKSIVFGGPNDKWKQGSITPAQANAANFGAWTNTLAFPSGSNYYIKIDTILMKIYYAEAFSEDVVCYQERAIEIGTEGIQRQSEKDIDKWGPIIPEGDFPYMPPGGLENKKMRGIIVPSGGNLETRPDTTDKKIFDAVVFYRPGYHFTSEAA